ncbi:MAG: formate--tetrahydrofolate ligase, partial [Treponema sp.]|nr:formate--tetrahydrofolate ligase [Treponema sp.]
KLRDFEEQGYKDLPVCVAKTQNSISHDPKLMGAPKDYIFPVRDVQLYSGAGFVVALAGEIMTMPGLPKLPAALNNDIDDDGNVSGLF